MTPAPPRRRAPSRDGRERAFPHRIEIRGPSASAEEAEAIAVAIERFLREAAPATGGTATSRWLRASLLERAGFDPGGPAPWGDPVPWGGLRRPAGRPRAAGRGPEKP